MQNSTIRATRNKRVDLHDNSKHHYVSSRIVYLVISWYHIKVMHEYAKIEDLNMCMPADKECDGYGTK